ncbi:50S ribosomal protein L13 [bacterium]|nr:50S ribosomal protein L13 [bacterium]
MKRLYKTAHLNRETVERKWYVVDAEDQVLGRLSSRIASILRGKHKPTWSPHVDGGDFVIVTNAEKVRLTGRKPEQKYYLHHTGYPGGMRKTPISRVLEKQPERVVRKAVWGMLPKNRLGRKMIKKLKVYSGPEHPHKAQKPESLPL